MVSSGYSGAAAGAGAGAGAGTAEVVARLPARKARMVDVFILFLVA